MHDAAREEYLKKIKGVEQLDEILSTGQEGFNRAFDSSGGTSQTSSTGEIAMPPRIVGISTPSSGGAKAYKVGDDDYVIPAIKKYPEKIELPSYTPSDRQPFQKIAQAFAQANYTDTTLFVPLKPDKFECDDYGDVGGGLVRYDLLFYLEELHWIISKELDMPKFQISSAFRTIAKNDKIYEGKSKKSEHSPHTGGIAVDIIAFENERYIIANAAYKMGFGGIAIGRDFVHIDISVKSFWSYDGVPKYKSPTEERVYE